MVQSAISMKFKIDGILQDCDGGVDSLLAKGKGATAAKHGAQSNAGASYAIRGQANPDVVLTFNLHADSLNTKTYVFNTERGFNIAELKLFTGSSYTRYYPYTSKSDSLVLKITRYANATIDGTFSGRLSLFDQAYTYNSINITEGEFKNLPVTYY